MSRILGLDLGSYSVKALLIESTFRGFELKRFAEARVGTGGLKEALAALAAEKHLGADQVVVALPGTAAATHVISLPFTDARRVEQTLAFEVEGVVPFDLAEVGYDYQVIATQEGRTDLLVGVARKADIGAVIELMRGVHLDPRVLTVSPLAYQSILALPSGADEAEAVVDIGHERTCVCVVGPHGPELARIFTGGGRDLTRAISVDLKAPPEVAEQLKEEQGSVDPAAVDPQDQKVFNALVRGLSPVVREVRASLRAHASRFKRPVRRVHLTGGTSRLRGLRRLLANELGTDVRELSALPPTAAGSVSRETEAVAAQAFALAMRGHGTSRSARFNLRRGDLAFQGDFQYLKGKVSRLAAFAVTLAILATVAGWARLYTLSVREAGYEQVLCQVTQRTLNQCVKDFTVALSMLKGHDSPAAMLPQISALDLFAELISRTPTDAGAKYDEIEVALNRIRVHGKAPSLDAVDRIVAGLNGYRCFNDIKRGRTQKSPDGASWTFDLDIAVTCPEVGAQG